MIRGNNVFVSADSILSPGDLDAAFSCSGLISFDTVLSNLRCILDTMMGKSMSLSSKVNVSQIHNQEKYNHKKAEIQKKYNTGKTKCWLSS